jgi:Biotin-requiring enzyme
VKAYHVRFDAAGAVPGGGALLEVAVEETAEGLRAGIVRRPRDPSGTRPPEAGRPAVTTRWYRVDLAEVVPGWYSVIIDGRSHTVGVATHTTTAGGARGGPPGRRHWTLLFDGEAVSVDFGRSTRGRGAVQSAAAAAAGQVRAPMPGLIVAIQAEPGTAVAQGETLIIMEAMKMQMEIRAPQAGAVRDVRVVPGQDVAGGDVLATLE